MNRKKVIIIISTILVVLVSTITIIFFSKDSKDKKVDIQKTVMVPDDQMYINEHITDISFDELFNDFFHEDNEEHSHDHKHETNNDESLVVSREDFIILLAKVLTKDNVNIIYENLNESTIPNHIKDNQNKNYYLYFMLNLAKDSDLDIYSYIFGEDTDNTKPIKKEEAIALMYHALQVTNDIKLDNSKDYPLITIESKFDKEIKEFSKYEELKNILIGEDNTVIKDEAVTLGELEKSLYEIYKHSEVEVISDNQLNPNYLYKKEDYNNAEVHNHDIPNEKIHQEKHALLHAILNYSVKYGKIPVKSEKLDVNKVPQSLIDQLDSYHYDIKDYQILDVDELYPEFLMEPYTSDTALVDVKKQNLFLLNGEKTNGVVIH